MPHPLVTQLQIIFAANRSDEALLMAKYMKNLFPFWGIKKPLRSHLEKPILQQFPIDSWEELQQVLRELWHLPEREFQYTALQIARNNHHLFREDSLNFFRWMLTTKSWWDSVDGISSWLVGTAIQKFPAQMQAMDAWIEDENMWVRRCALIFQLSYRHHTNWQRLQKYCLHCMPEKEFFIRKAIGWALREYSKTEPTKVISFVDKYATKLSPLSSSEALKWLKKQTML